VVLGEAQGQLYLYLYIPKFIRLHERNGKKILEAKNAEARETHKTKTDVSYTWTFLHVGKSY